MKALLAVDVREADEASLNQAAVWATRFAATIDLIFVEDYWGVSPVLMEPSIPDYALLAYEKMQEAHRKRLEALLEMLPAEQRGEGLLRLGRPADEVISAAEDYDIVLVATHGRTGVQHLFLGSVAEQIVRRSPVPVLVLRAESA